MQNQDENRLVKVNNHYVPWNYIYWIHNKKERKMDIREDVNAFFPKIKFNKEFNKWEVTFISADIGGYDIQKFKWYFDNKQDILKEMFK